LIIPYSTVKKRALRIRLPHQPWPVLDADVRESLAPESKRLALFYSHNAHSGPKRRQSVLAFRPSGLLSLRKTSNGVQISSLSVILNSCHPDVRFTNSGETRRHPKPSNEGHSTVPNSFPHDRHRHTLHSVGRWIPFVIKLPRPKPIFSISPWIPMAHLILAHVIILYSFPLLNPRHLLHKYNPMCFGRGAAALAE